MNIITKEILINNGFEILEKETEIGKDFYFQNPEYIKTNPEDYISMRKWTDELFPLKLDIDNGWNNSNSEWHLHIDNSSCQTIGGADISTVEQFNKLMEVFNSNFKLN